MSERSGSEDSGVCSFAVEEAPAHFQGVAELKLLVVVGVTGVGKSTVVHSLERRMPCVLLPDRRALADHAVFPLVQDDLGEPRHPVRDRVERFRLTARYRELHPGGMAHALTRLRVDPTLLDGRLLVFDGLRGVDEVRWAIGNLPRTRFLALRAPEATRLQRLLGRDQGFDYASVPGEVPTGERRDIGTLLAAVPGLEALVPPADLAALIDSPALADVPLEEIAQKAAILVEEARNYDPMATVQLLDAELGPWRSLIVNTAVVGPEETAERVARWLA